MPTAIFRAIWRYGGCLFATAEGEGNRGVRERGWNERRSKKNALCPVRRGIPLQSSHLNEQPIGLWLSQNVWCLPLNASWIFCIFLLSTLLLRDFLMRMIHARLQLLHFFKLHCPQWPWISLYFSWTLVITQNCHTMKCYPLIIMEIHTSITSWIMKNQQWQIA